VEWIVRRFTGHGRRGQQAGLLAWTDLEQSDFFNWFGLHEIGRATTAAEGWSAIQLEPDGHQQAIDLTVYVDSLHRVQRAVLSLNRSWADGGQTAKLADDLVQSFLRAVGGRHPEAALLANQIISLERGSQPILRVTPPVGAAATPIPNVQAMLCAYRGRRKRAELVAPGVLIEIENWLVDGQPRFMTVIASTVPPLPPGQNEAVAPGQKSWWRFR
jgi:hypothetical protein